MQITFRDIENKNKIIDEKQKQIDQLKETVRIYKVSDELVKEQSKKVKHLFPLENTAGYGQLCDKVVEQQKEINSLEKRYDEQLDESQRTYDYFKQKIERYEKAVQLALMTLENNNLMNDDYRKVHSILDGDVTGI